MNSANAMLSATDRHADWLPLLEVASREVFELMLGCKLTAPEATAEATYTITAMVGLAGKLCGVLSVRCDEKSAALMTSKMLGVDLDKIGAGMSESLLLRIVRSTCKCPSSLQRFSLVHPALAEDCVGDPDHPAYSVVPAGSRHQCQQTVLWNASLRA